MAKYRVAFAAKGRDVGKIVELDPVEARELVKYGRLVPVVERPAQVGKPAEGKPGK